MSSSSRAERRLPAWSPPAAGRKGLNIAPIVTAGRRIRIICDGSHPTKRGRNGPRSSVTSGPAGRGALGTRTRVPAARSARTADTAATVSNNSVIASRAGTLRRRHRRAARSDGCRAAASSSPIPSARGGEDADGDLEHEAHRQHRHGGEVVVLTGLHEHVELAAVKFWQKRTAAAARRSSRTALRPQNRNGIASISGVGDAGAALG